LAESSAAAGNLAWSDALVAGLAAGGVTHAVLAPGSRSTPLALALDRQPAVDLTVLPDERCAAFFALGLSRDSGRPALFVCTSGTAAAHAFPAILEAAADGVPLIVISADRPAELQHTGANQTTDQTDLFGRHVRLAITLPAPEPGAAASVPRATGRRAAETACWPLPGPVHLNVALREPLVPASPPDAPAPAVDNGYQRPACQPDARAVESLAARIDGRPGIIVCGRGPRFRRWPATVARLARRLGAPILADPLSGLRWGPHDRRWVLTAFDLFLRGPALPAAARPDWVLQFGATPVSAVLQSYLASCGARRCLIGTGGDWQDPTRGADGRLLADAVPLAEALVSLAPAAADSDWGDVWFEAESRGATLAATPELRPPEADVVTALESALPPDALLFVGNSLPIRAVDQFARGHEGPLAIHGNRGLSGIDGNVSTALGLGHASGRRPVALLGDLTLYHDMNGLLATRDTPADIVLLDNGGGGIFGLLPQAGLPAFERLWLTPTGLDPARIAALYGLDYASLASGDALAAALAGGPEDHGRSRLLHVPIDRELSIRRFTDLWRAAGATEDRP
jgi:2-succinyl-5-enolpyruvyl-6-hydroxy-3-cyclohexene-1-carboxylate synthase